MGGETIRDDSASTQHVVHSLEALFEPRSIAILGASVTTGNSGNDFVKELVAGGWRGEIYPINRSGSEVHGIRAYRSIDDVTASVDVIVSCLPAAVTPDNVLAAAHRGARFAIINTSGFAELGGEWAQAQEWMVREARRAGMRIVGPNCQGLINSSASLNLSALPPPTPGPVAIISQGGSIPTTLFPQALKCGLGFSKIITFGNQADIAAHEYLDYVGHDDATSVIILHLESLGLGCGPEFLRVAREVSRTKPIIALKGGRSANGKRASASHTAGMAGDAMLYSALFRDAGVIEVMGQSDLLPMAEALYRCPPLEGRRVAAVGSGGTWAILGTDGIENEGLEVAPFSRRLAADVAIEMKGWAAPRNPVDMAGEFMRDLALFAKFTRGAFEDTPAFDGALNFAPFGIWHGSDYCDAQGLTYEGAAVLLGEVQTDTGKPIIFYSPFAGVENAAFTRMRQGGIPCYDSLELAARCLGALRKRAMWLEEAPWRDQKAQHSAPSSGGVVGRIASGRPNHNLTEPESYTLLARYGAPVVDWRIGSSIDQVLDAADRVGYPVVLKAVSPEIVHKSGVGAVSIDIKDRSTLGVRADAMMRSLGDQGLASQMTGFLVARHEPAMAELLVGAIRDPALGPMIAVGMGGIYAEVLGDIVFGTVPVTTECAERMISRLRCYPILMGARGKNPVELEQLTELLITVGTLMVDEPEVSEIDLNPVLVSPDGSIRIADARVVAQA